MVEYHVNRASETELAGHLRECDDDFVPRLSERATISEYARKIAGRAVRFEAWHDHDLIGLLAVYCDDPDRRAAFITSVSVLRAWTGRGIARHLISRCIDHVKGAGFAQIGLEVSRDNVHAVKLYEQCGFIAAVTDRPLMTMLLDLQ